ncbi:MAG: RNA-binding protein [Bacillota bacterium]|uniref:Ribosomal protein L14E/L6E/L27E n=2 Tax=Carboxydocella TaxID=178898 RepID=A0A1T4S9Z9_9FIRM|nr:MULTISPECIES: KOW domain-containing RNA-binding protein [Carboxydocella]AVX21785.1 hypothetical protein CFE_2642 [Carboxydocella thermautotrophica]AVX32189.1 hypothetical protein CTH_2652 [Carboxydocella thermautotrophica]SKA25059.1 hypothetical protein SAMN02745885_02541 [Carboxydocella sporoproducens DSM 16521]GAW27583.1 hypothetical protein ULO1_01530 [Carboxydocella sp. ULO1]GAW30909.1 hypothetical protein JDF658_06740 [Carboxydocella sp. JDF658]
MAEKELQIGQLVYSRAGRDQGRPFLVWDYLSDTMVAVVDGDLRKVESPKKKNIKHLKAMPAIAEEIARKKLAGVRIFNHEVRKALKDLGAIPEQ